MTWNAATDYPQTRRDAAGCEWNGLFIVCGGKTSGSTFSTMFAEVYSYDHATTSWTARNALPITRCEHAVAQVGGEMFVMGGQGGGSSYNTRVDKCVMSTDTWSTMSASPYGARWPRAAVLSGDIHLIGGETSVANAVDTHALYDVSANSWSTLTALPAARKAGALVAAGGLLYYLGGVNLAGALVDTVYIYDPSAGSWSTGTALPVAMERPAAWVDSLGRVWVSDGRDASGPTQPLYRLDGASWTTVETSQLHPRYGSAYATVGQRLHRAAGEPSGGGFSATHYYWQLAEATTRPRLRGGQVIYGELRGGQRWN